MVANREYLKSLAILELYSPASKNAKIKGSSEDNNPHGLRILELMESNGYRVCYHRRDFVAGAAITENTIQAIERSKRTVCLYYRTTSSKGKT